MDQLERLYQIMLFNYTAWEQAERPYNHFKNVWSLQMSSNRLHLDSLCDFRRDEWRAYVRARDEYYAVKEVSMKTSVQ